MRYDVTRREARQTADGHAVDCWDGAIYLGVVLEADEVVTGVDEDGEPAEWVLLGGDRCYLPSGAADSIRELLS